MARIIYANNSGRNILREEFRENKGMVRVLNKEELKHTPIDYIKDIQSSWINGTANIPNAPIYNKIITTTYSDKIDETIINNPIITYLETLVTKDKMAYNIDGVLISRIKVLRIFTTLSNNGHNNNDALLYSMVYNSLLTQEQYKKIISIFTTQHKIGGR